MSTNYLERAKSVEFTWAADPHLKISPSYRSPKAQHAHTTIINYIVDRVKESELTKMINDLAIDALMEPSCNGCTHFLDVVHLPFEMTKNESAKKCSTLMHLLCARAKSLGGDALSFLLTKPSKDGFTPLHDVLKSGDAQNVKDYFDEVHDALKMGLLDKASYRVLLIKANHAGFTPLLDVLKSGNPENLKIYLAEVRKAVENGILSQREYNDLFMKANHAGFTPAHDVLKWGNTENVKTFFDEVRKAVESELLTPKNYRDMHLSENQAGSTPLQSGNTTNLKAYINELRNAIQKGLFAANDYRDLLKRANYSGFSPLQQIITKGTYEDVQFFLKELEEFLSPRNYADELHRKWNFRDHFLSPAKNINAPEINRLLEEKRKRTPRPLNDAPREDMSNKENLRRDRDSSPQRRRYDYDNRDYRRDRDYSPERCIPVRTEVVPDAGVLPPVSGQGRLFFTQQ
jgi:hypothetical protein